MKNDLPSRKNLRLQNFDYGKHGAYFITICTSGRKHILSEIVNGDILSEQYASNDVGCDSLVGGQSRTPVPTEETIKNSSTGNELTLNATVGGDVLDAPQIKLLKHGEIADKYLRQLNDFYKNISVEKYVIMPNHIHLILFVENIPSILNNLEIEDGGASRTSPPTMVNQHSTVAKFISTFKRFCNKECGDNIWQRSFYDHIIRNQNDYNEVVKYIDENPIKWRFDKLYVNDIF